MTGRKYHGHESAEIKHIHARSLKLAILRLIIFPSRNYIQPLSILIRVMSNQFMGALMDYQIPKDSWQLFLETVKKADSAMNEILDDHPMGPLLNQFLHMVVWEQGVEVARWVLNNKDLVRRLNKIQSFTKEEFEPLAAEVKKSVERLSRT